MICIYCGILVIFPLQTKILGTQHFNEQLGDPANQLQ